jgi:hypothetical protein
VFALIFGFVVLRGMAQRAGASRGGVVVATGIYTILRERAVTVRATGAKAAPRTLNGPSGRHSGFAPGGRGAVDTPIDSPYTARHLAGVLQSASPGPQIQICSGHDPGRLSAPIL